eukprot:365387-Chlamydomonas_euryale.AAC.3
MDAGAPQHCTFRHVTLTLLHLFSAVVARAGVPAPPAVIATACMAAAAISMAAVAAPAVPARVGTCHAVASVSAAVLIRGV